MAETDFERRLVRRCLNGDQDAWHDLVDYLYPFLHATVHRTLAQFGLNATSDQRDDLLADVFQAILDDDRKVLRDFTGQSRLSTYLVVVARRTMLRRLARKKAREKSERSVTDLEMFEADLESSSALIDQIPDHEPTPDQQAQIHDELAQIIQQLNPREAQVVHRYFILGQTYQEISQAMDIPTNTLGPLLSRIKERVRDHQPADEGHPKQFKLN